MSLSTLRTQIRDLRRRAASRPAAGDPAPWDWYAPGCPCGLPPGECHDHPRARPSQRPPEGDWRTWFVLAGRGFGKSRTGAEWVRGRVAAGKARRVALVAPTAADARDTMVEGESGLLAVSPPWDRPRYEPSRRRLTWPNGAQAATFSADEPERLRGPQHDLAWIDEPGSWRRPAALDNLRLGLRLGAEPRLCVTGTPRATALVKALLAGAATVRTGGTTYENARHLAADFLAEVRAKYEGTRLGRQEIHAELLPILEGVWFSSFDPARHVSAAAEYRAGVPVRLAIDCGTSRHTGAVFYQVEDLDSHRRRVTVFGDFYAVDLFSEAAALAIQARAAELCGGRVDLVRLDPASSARTGVGPAALGEYERVFGRRLVAFWPSHQVLDGLDQLELLLGPETREPDLLIHPRCGHLVAAFNGYTRAQRNGEWMSWPLDPNHPHEDLMDALRGGVRDAMPEGRKPQPEFRRFPMGRVL